MYNLEAEKLCKERDIWRFVRMILWKSSWHILSCVQFFNVIMCMFVHVSAVLIYRGSQKSGMF